MSTSGLKPSDIKTKDGKVLNIFTKRYVAPTGRSYTNMMKAIATSKVYDEQRDAFYLLMNPAKPSRYADIDDKYFCGTRGGYPAPLKKFPVDTEEHCQRALAYARVAPYPEGIRRCALQIAESKGWNCGAGAGAKKVNK